MSETQKKANSATNETKQNLDLFNLTSEQIAEADASTERPKTNLGFVKLSLPKGKTKRNIRLRLIQNFWGGTLDHVNKTIAQVDTTYVKPSFPVGGGQYYDSQKKFTGADALNTKYWQLYNSKNPVEKDKASSIKMKDNYYSYALIESDSEGILSGLQIIQYGRQLKKKIEMKKNGELGAKVSIFNPSKGAVLNVVCDLPKGATMPTYADSFWSDDNTSIDYAKYSQAWIQEEMNKLKNLDDFTERKLTPEQDKNVDAIIRYINSGNSNHVSKSDKVDLLSEDNSKPDLEDEDDGSVTTDEYFNINK